ncbi:GIY-YIG nuclease family protein [Pseudomonas sp. HMWF021]|uniref:GIY-YIG nuclease family protein n=1 Tax=Pseudomonas sp. HMWF021 TaxID=2056857 RepID=UPI000D3A8F20|nr:GIY-YIG nuclease family protein [Pseudomonas sp. HMWF021]PTT24256.1 hypothetical protein DBR18_27970 [Pseudomonas sp. HMWF021]
MSKRPEPQPGFIYIFRDHLNNNLIKVGFSKDPLARRKQLHTTGTALPMTIYHVWNVGDKYLAEQAAHEVLRGHRVNDRREFFEIAPLPHFSSFERTNYDITSDFLYTLKGLIEEGWDFLEIEYCDASPAEVREVHNQSR